MCGVAGWSMPYSARPDPSTTPERSSNVYKDWIASIVVWLDVGCVVEFMVKFKSRRRRALRRYISRAERRPSPRSDSAKPPARQGVRR
jgi:hypothetical protein